MRAVIPMFKGKKNDDPYRAVRFGADEEASSSRCSGRATSRQGLVRRRFERQFADLHRRRARRCGQQRHDGTRRALEATPDRTW